MVILLDRHADAASLRSDWTCTHEFLHPGRTRLPAGGRLAVRGARDVLHGGDTSACRHQPSRPQAYQHLLDGFARGRSGSGSAHTLRATTMARMRARHAFYRVYWSGAALAFLTDIAARRAGGSTLDGALRSFADCCAASEEDWTAERVLARLDASLGAPRFADRARTWLDRKEFPEHRADRAARARCRHIRNARRERVTQRRAGRGDPQRDHGSRVTTQREWRATLRASSSHEDPQHQQRSTGKIRVDHGDQPERDLRGAALLLAVHENAHAHGRHRKPRQDRVAVHAPDKHISKHARGSLESRGPARDSPLASPRDSHVPYAPRSPAFRSL